MSEIIHLERLKECLNLAIIKDEDKDGRMTLNLEGGSLFIEHFLAEDDSRELVRIAVYDKSFRNPIVNFSLGEKGLERIGFGFIALTSGNGDINVLEPVSVGMENDWTSHHVPYSSEEKFSQLSKPLVEWVEKMVTGGKIDHQLPIQITTTGKS